MKDCGSSINADSSSCKPAGDGPSLSNLDAIVRAYLREHQPCLQAQLRSFAEEATVLSAVSRAALARSPDGKKYSHQHRLKLATLQEVQRRLLDLDLEGIRTFDELYNAIEGTVGSITGVGELMVYDTALRIGAKLGLEPERVYLHSGTRQGARVLRLRSKECSLAPTELPLALRALRPHEVEDCLCIYKGRFA